MSTHQTAADTITSQKQRKMARFQVPVNLWADSPVMYFGTTQFSKDFSSGDVNQFNNDFIGILEEIRKLVERNGIQMKGDEKSHFQNLRTLGKAAYNKFLSPPARDYLIDLEQREKNRGISLTFNVSPDLSLLWEMIYAGSPLSMDFDQFWGFRYPIGRLYWGTNISDRVYLQDGFFTAIHDQLVFSKSEITNIKLIVDEINKSQNQAFRFQLLDDFILNYDPSIEQLINVFHSEDFRYGIVHFACHCENPKDSGASKSYLRITACDAKLDIKLQDLLVWEDYKFRNSPFIFLNTCQSATLGHLMETTNFPSEFLKFGAGCVIATACTIPDNFASAFASEFYRRLFENFVTKPSVNIGEILLETRFHFLDKYNNPLGLAYGLYAYSNQGLQTGAVTTQDTAGEPRN